METSPGNFGGPYSRSWKPLLEDHGIYPTTIKEDTTVSVALLLTGLCVGLPWLLGSIVWLCVLCKKNHMAALAARKALTVLNVSLVLVALLQCLSSPAMAKLLLDVDGSCWPIAVCNKFALAWLASRHCGLMFQQLAALEFAFRKLRRVYCSLPVVFTLVVVCLLFTDVDATYAGRASDGTVEFNVGLGALACVFAVATCLGVACFLCCRRKDRGARRRKAVALALALVSFCMYVPSFAVSSIIVFNAEGSPLPVGITRHNYNIMLYLNNLRLVTDAGLFWLITRESSPPNTTGGDGSVWDPPNSFVLQSDKL